MTVLLNKVNKCRSSIENIQQICKFIKNPYTSDKFIEQTQIVKN